MELITDAVARPQIDSGITAIGIGEIVKKCLNFRRLPCRIRFRLDKPD